MKYAFSWAATISTISYLLSTYFCSCLILYFLWILWLSVDIHISYQWNTFWCTIIRTWYKISFMGLFFANNISGYIVNVREKVVRVHNIGCKTWQIRPENAFLIFLLTKGSPKWFQYSLQKRKKLYQIW